MYKCLSGLIIQILLILGVELVDTGPKINIWIEIQISIYPKKADWTKKVDILETKTLDFMRIIIHSLLDLQPQKPENI